MRPHATAIPGVLRIELSCTEWDLANPSLAEVRT